VGFLAAWREKSKAETQPVTWGAGFFLRHTR
jgi:hypothetical protein